MDSLGLVEDEDGAQALVRLLPVEAEVPAAAGVCARLACVVNGVPAFLEHPISVTPLPVERELKPEHVRASRCCSLACSTGALDQGHLTIWLWIAYEGLPIHAAHVPGWLAAKPLNAARGRRNHYTINRQHAMRHTAQIGHEIGTLLNALSTNP